MRCTNCGTELIAGKQFCHACGARVSQACPNCGSSVAPGFRFCPDCGFQMSAPVVDAPAPAADNSLARFAGNIPEELAQKIRASEATVEGERKQVTVLFCDLAGSTAIAERLDPEEYHDLLEQYVALAFREIYGVEGIVNQLAGDGMMALFGAPIAHEDAPQRAVRAALGIHEALGRFNHEVGAERGIELHARIGIHTGPVVVGTVGNDLKMDYTAIGDTTNLASRLESLAEPGTILVSEATYRLLRGLFTAQRVGPFAVKGKSEPVSAYAILGFGEATAPMDLAAERGLTPLVGRDAELAQIEACYRRLNEYLAQVVTIVGDAGSGKSRLIYEFKQRLAGEPVVFFEARCSAWNQMVPYYPFVAMLKQYFDLSADEPEGCACDKLARKLRAFGGQLDHIYPFLCQMLSLPVPGGGQLPADEMKQAEFEAVSHLIVAESERALVVMIIEDLHWMDEPSREMLAAAVAHMGTKRVMLLVSHRPDYQPAWRTHAAFTQLHLRPLGDEDVTGIVRTLAGGPLPPELERMILTKVEGSPFLAEEITRSLIEEGNLTRDDGHHRLVRPVEDIRIPGTVQEVIAARLDRLGAGAKRVVQVAAVLGRQFSRAHLVELLAGEGMDVNHELEELERRGVIHRKNLFSNDEYRFGESLTQEVAYEGLLLKQRRQLHERVGLLLEASAGERSAERAALLAHHFARSDNREKSVDALLQAARDAERVPSYRTAARLYREAWNAAEAGVAKDPSGHLQRKALEAATDICRMAVIYGAPDPGDNERVVRRARQLAEALGDVAALGSLGVYLGMMLMGSDREKFAEGLALAEDGLAVAQRAGHTATTARISRGLAWSYLLDGRFALAQRTIDWVVEELERAEQGQRPSDVYLGSRWMRERVRYYSDDLEGAQRGVAETYELAVAGANRTVQSSSAGTLAQIHFMRGEYRAAKRWAERGVELALALGNLSNSSTTAAIAIVAGAALVEPVATAHYLDLIEQAVSAGSDIALNSNIIVGALLAIDELPRAERLAQLAYSRAGGRLRELHSALALGDLMSRLGAAHWDEAERWYNQSIALAEALGARSAMAAARIGAGELAAARGDHAAGTRQGRPALALCRALGLGRYQPRAERLLERAEDPAESRISDWSPVS